jgi:tRNA (guanine-N7-)-methyltransferase
VANADQRAAEIARQAALPSVQGAQPALAAISSTAAQDGLIYRPPNYFKLLDLNELFPRSAALEVELGSGDGSFLVNYAQAFPQRNFLGVERLLGRLRKVDRKGRRAGLTNLRVIRIEAGYFMEYLLPANSTQALHVYFPDPWPKRKHRKNRLVNEHFVHVAARVLQPNGRVYLRTDDADYFAQMTAVFRASSSFHPIETPPELQAFLTDFERGFQARGVPSLRAGFERSGPAE